jgi:2-dehydro-3-deoxyphosphogluconate aldolase/(4S)-4-hydroxy-2-oxoglutarate aldolase
VLVGAGTVLSVDQVKTAVDAGARFIVSPGFNPAVVEYCVQNAIPITPGCCNPTDIEGAMAFGLGTVKFFPADAFGGLKTIKALAAPYGQLRFIPTGGVDENNMLEYLAFDRVLAVGGSFMVRPEWIREGRFDEVTRCTCAAVNRMLGFELAHVGINSDNEDEAARTAGTFAKVFSFEVKAGASSIFAGPGIEVNKSAGIGRHGHLAIRTNSIARAIAYLKGAGVDIDMSTAKEKNGKMIAVYLADEIGGFGVHLLQK